MFNLNDPKLTKQEKEFMLSLQTDKELDKEVIRQKQKGNNICFPSYWVVQTKDLIKFNKGAHQIDTSFDFYAEELEKCRIRLQSAYTIVIEQCKDVKKRVNLFQDLGKKRSFS